MNSVLSLEESSKIRFEDLKLSLMDIYASLGGRQYAPTPEISKLVDAFISSIAGICKPEYGMKVCKFEKLDSHGFEIEDVAFNPGPVIAPILSEGEYLCVFVATCGREFQDWMEAQAKSGDIVKEFVSNCIGSELAESVARYVLEKLKSSCRNYGLNAGNSYSPGYCGWHVAEQKKVFHLLHGLSCGVTLSDSCLMMPIKSITGMIPVGRNIVKKNYSCEICPRKDCYKKIR